MSSGWVISEADARKRDLAIIRQYKRAKLQCAGMPQHYQDSVWRMHRYGRQECLEEVPRIHRLADKYGVNL